ncbi:MAG: DUF481 domain-containing protein [Gemmatimonadetes bacterium]|mgnify:CR=1 FL=1|jgi:hypothetical protein|nr:DUF481 domain-containing protein [Gemmatimonadota bacterium]MBK6457493.1 DUF481 domain-containing protein [Gemmatimonadota bacterium]MBP9106881.1 DUF481 domain-containing protein [Gemmatimonadaceae bacterium]HNV73850.1 DUF481 domain-containing protein [Gemmatimonadaceae bacterium]HPV75342.1 DUF481 domain-containing protein [Gemmatimonadaceae bacterium]
MRLRYAAVCLLSVVVLGTPAHLTAQSTPVAKTPPRPWSGSVEAAASLYQGNTEQRALFTRTELGRADSTLQVRGTLSFGYADAARDSVPRAVTKRTWIGTVALDYRPFDHLSPFLFVNYEASYEKRVLDRVGVGLGGKAVLLSTGATEANISLAMLAERMRPTSLSPDSAIIAAARWSGRARFKHQFDPRLKLSHTTFWQPRVTDLESYTVNSTSELSLAVRQSTSFTVSYLALYDSAARSRGARNNNDAQLLFGVKTGF